MFCTKKVPPKSQQFCKDVDVPMYICVHALAHGNLKNAFGNAKNLK